MSWNKYARIKLRALPVAVWLLAWLASASASAVEPPTGIAILKVAFPGSTNWWLKPDGDLEVNGQKINAKCEGHGTGPQNFTTIKDPVIGGRVLHYLCAAQWESDFKARQEHYLYLAPLQQTFVSEFSLKLDDDFTPVKILRPDGGRNWCILHQWHQGHAIDSRAKSPPISLQVEPGTSNVLEWVILFGSDAPDSIEKRQFGEQRVTLGKWYHFRVEWNVSPNQNGRCIVQMSDQKLPSQLTAKETLFRYRGPIGYVEPSVPVADYADHGPTSIREQMGIYQGPHLNLQAHHGFSVANVSIYRLK